MPQLGISVFEVPQAHGKGRRRSRVVVCNSVAQSIVESVRGQHETHVFVWRRERRSRTELEPVMNYRPIEAKNNTAWQRARKEAGLGDSFATRWGCDCEKPACRRAPCRMSSGIQHAR